MSEPTFRAIPVLRIFDRAKAKEFYLDFLGFRLEWQHRFADGAPVYLQIARGDLVLHLSDHHGDGSPGAVVYVRTTGLAAFHCEITAKNYPFMPPGPRAYAVALHAHGAHRPVPQPAAVRRETCAISARQLSAAPS
jgi:catechol 2,3-dioxygenase-like lactoylglutathione lyase family enzyme